MGLLAVYMANREQEWDIFVLMSLRVQVSPMRIRVPDIVVIAGSIPAKQILTRPPFLCIEILSPADRVMETQERINDYLIFGVSYVWLINPRTRETYIYTQSGLRESEDGILTTENPNIRVDLNLMTSTALARRTNRPVFPLPS